MRIGILTGGGDAPGLNAAIRAVARRALPDGHTVLGIRNGWAGLGGDADLFELDRGTISGILQLGGTMLGSSRTNPLRKDGGVDQVLASLDGAGLGALVAIGGDDTLSVAAELARRGAPVVGVPKTMDNDLSVTEYCIGFDSAVSIVTEALDRLHTTAASHHRVMVVEVMGRDTGWVAVMGGLAGGADMIVIPEFSVSLDEVCAHVRARGAQGSSFSVVVVSEGAELEGVSGRDEGDHARDAFGHVQLSRRGVGETLGNAIAERTGHDTRVTVLGHTQRGGSPTAFDRIWATQVGAHAYDLIARQAWGKIGAVRCGGVEDAELSDVVAEQRRVPEQLYRLAQVFF